MLAFERKLKSSDMVTIGEAFFFFLSRNRRYQAIGTYAPAAVRSNPIVTRTAREGSRCSVLGVGPRF